MRFSQHNREAQEPPIALSCRDHCCALPGVEGRKKVAGDHNGVFLERAFPCANEAAIDNDARADAVKRFFADGRIKKGTAIFVRYGEFVI